MNNEVEIRLLGLRARGFHGCDEAERREGQDFEIDVVFAYREGVRADDSLRMRPDYAAVADEALAVFSARPRAMIETVAHEIADTLFSRHRSMTRLSVVVRKSPPSMRDRLGRVEAEVSRRR